MSNMKIVDLAPVLLLYSTLVAPAQSDSELLPYVFEPLPVGSIKPRGWLHDTLRAMGDGLPGNMAEFYVYVSNSTWVGRGYQYTPIAEGASYWFNYIVPLAYGLDDERLKGQVKWFVDYVVDHIPEDGWVGPPLPDGGHDLWGRFPFMLGLTQLLEADPSYVSRVLPVMFRFQEIMNGMLHDNNRGYSGWGAARGHDMMMTTQWLLEHHPEGQKQLLVDNLWMLKAGAFDWSQFFSKAMFPKGNLDMLPDAGIPFEFVHVVNLGQALKWSGVVRRFTHDDTLIQTAWDSVNWTFTYHGSAASAIVGDERIAGTSPSRGAELCGVVETMHSLSYLFKTIGNKAFADRCEATAFNSLTVMTTADHWAHQYVSLTNLPFSHRLPETPFWNVNDVGVTYGLEPHFAELTRSKPCCTTNHPQGFPKFVSNMFVKVGRSGLGHALLGPGSVTATLFRDNTVTIDCETTYPFGSTLFYTINAKKTMYFLLRVPEWALPSSFIREGTSPPSLLTPNKKTGMHLLKIAPGRTLLTYTLHSALRIESRPRDTVAVHLGPLLYALEIQALVSSQPARAWNDNRHKLPDSHLVPQVLDYAMHNASAWAVAIDPSTITIVRGDEQLPLPNPVWTPGGPPGWMEVVGCEIEWGIERGVPAEPPLKGQRRCTAPPRKWRLVPYGSAKIHIAEFPTVELGAESVSEDTEYVGLKEGPQVPLREEKYDL
ncbi:MAG: hypothetical protein M1814_000626 [Vezdaea aestivalis]|nr:MAG: hypothetical protein M1814_000626 [Vezdaea aestivalis]